MAETSNLQRFVDAQLGRGTSVVILDNWHPAPLHWRALASLAPVLIRRGGTLSLEGSPIGTDFLAQLRANPKTRKELADLIENNATYHTGNAEARRQYVRAMADLYFAASQQGLDIKFNEGDRPTLSDKAQDLFALTAGSVPSNPVDMHIMLGIFYDGLRPEEKELFVKEVGPWLAQRYDANNPALNITMGTNMSEHFRSQAGVGYVGAEHKGLTQKLAEAGIRHETISFFPSRISTGYNLATGETAPETLGTHIYFAESDELIKIPTAPAARAAFLESLKQAARPFLRPPSAARVLSVTARMPAEFVDVGKGLAEDIRQGKPFPFVDLSEDAKRYLQPQRRGESPSPTQHAFADMVDPSAFPNYAWTQPIEWIGPHTARNAAGAPTLQGITPPK